MNVLQQEKVREWRGRGSLVVVARGGGEEAEPLLGDDGDKEIMDS